MNKFDLSAQRKLSENEFTKWVNETPERIQKHGEVLQGIKDAGVAYVERIISLSRTIQLGLGMQLASERELYMEALQEQSNIKKLLSGCKLYNARNVRYG
ncbi:MAG: hypothetical protein ACJA0U_001800 [Salibacteraceae bacterium]